MFNWINTFQPHYDLQNIPMHIISCNLPNTQWGNPTDPFHRRGSGLLAKMKKLLGFLVKTHFMHYPQ